MTYDFNYAIKCDTFDQIEQLARIAKSQGKTVQLVSKRSFDKGHVWFRPGGVDEILSNYGSAMQYRQTTFAQFIKSP